MKNRLPLDCGVRRSAAVAARAAIVGMALLGASTFGSTLSARDIINNPAPADNQRAETFQTSDASDFVGGMFDAGAATRVALPAPTGAATTVDAAEYRFPFVFPSKADVNAMTAIDLLCSPDKGATWYAYASALADDRRKEFLFQAPKPGEYWFALMTTFKSGKKTYSSTRAMTFAKGATASAARPDESADDSFALADDSEDDYSAPTFDPDALGELAEMEPPPILPQNQRDDELLVDNASFAAEDVQPEATMPTAPDAATGAKSAPPRPGKLKNLSFGVGKGSGSLMVTVRWFRPADLEAQYASGIKSVGVERGPSPSGPWTIIAEDLDVNENGYSWTATADEMKPFYVRTVALDSQGNVWRDVTTAPLDVNQPGVRSALGPVKTPVPFDDAPPKAATTDSSDDGSEAKTDDAETKKMIRHAASSDEKENDAPEDEEPAPEDNSKRSKDVRLKPVVARSQSQTTAAPRERPYVPAPTNPNEFQLNPLFTQGFSVLYHASQARAEPSQPGKRSIFTPPSRARQTALARPAELRPSQRQLAQEQIARERQAYEERVRNSEARQMQTFEEKPELMEGRMFYMDSNGNLTTTPPPEMRQALNYGSLENQGWTRVDDAGGGATTASIGMTSADGSESIYMPRDAEAYDASARSGAAVWSNSMYPNASSPGSSPINNRYSDGAQNSGDQIPVNTNGGNAPAQTSPQTYYSPYDGNVSPYYVSNAAATSAEDYAFPPKPSVSQ